MDDLLTLDDLSHRLGEIPISTLKHRIAQLGVQPAKRGARNKLYFAPDALAILQEADRLIKAGGDLGEVRGQLGREALAPAPAKAAPDPEALDRLGRALEMALHQLQAKDQELARLNEELRRALEASATFQQKTFYLQGELQRMQGDLRDARREATEAAPGPAFGPLPWRRLWKKGEP